jgi:folate-binding protein YgfZ
MFSPEGYQALRHDAGIIRRGDRGILAVTGSDRLAWLQGLLTNDVAALPVGGVCDAAYLTPQGRMITDLRVVNLADRTLLDVPASLAEGLRAKLDALIFAEDAQVANASNAIAIVDLHGPAAPVVRERAAARLLRDANAVVADVAFGVPGYSVFAATARVDGVVDALVAAGAKETTLATLDVLRVEAGRPAFLIDMDEHTLPLEAGIEDRAISFTKGCYVGQEVIVRVVHRGHGRVAKKLVGLRLAPGELPKAGDVLLSGDRDIGRVTSAVWSPTLQCGIALGYVHRDFVEPATAVSVRTAAGPLGATISALPFV